MLSKLDRLRILKTKFLSFLFFKKKLNICQKMEKLTNIWIKKRNILTKILKIKVKITEIFKKNLKIYKNCPFFGCNQKNQIKNFCFCFWFLHLCSGSALRTRKNKKPEKPESAKTKKSAKFVKNFLKNLLLKLGPVF